MRQNLVLFQKQLLILLLMNSIMAYIWLRPIFFVSLRVGKFRPCRQPYNMVFYSFCFTLCSASIQKSISFNSIVGQPLSQRAHIQVKQIVISTLESIQIILAMGENSTLNAFKRL